MSRWIRVCLTLAIALATLGSAPAAFAQDGPEQPSIDSMTVDQIVNCEPDGTQTSGAVYRICMPPNWWYNGDLVIYAHGYVAPYEPVAIPEDQLCLPDNGPCLPDIINVLGYGFATTSYSTNGLAVQQGVADVVDLVNVFAQTHGQPNHVYLVGVSEGGLVTALTTEQYPNIFDGGVAACGPVGDFRYQVNYFGNFRAVFDYFYPGLIPGDPVNVPPALVPIWEDYYQTDIKPVIFDPANASKLQQVMAVTKAPVDPGDPVASTEHSVKDALWYQIVGTNDATAKLGGQPFDNQRVWYRGSVNDWQLNLMVQRIAADPAALAQINAHLQTSGVLTSPLVTMHTTLDQQVPYAHEVFYRLKTLFAGSGLKHINIP
ncbi:MAG: prolyl oligopeptidase family serine peptidase, partial [Anaerolineae bacterium]|nr:prolyl oligopeptidase family serine peptidase [Anaerolineae bacterium]